MAANRRYGWLVPVVAALAMVGGSWLSLADDSPDDRFFDVNVPPGLPPHPALNHLDKRMVELGRKLFFDRRLAFNGTISCGMCHIESQGFASTQSATAVGLEGQSLRRNAPTVLNVVYQKELFHDGREPSLAGQVWSPFLSPIEMGNPSVGYLIKRILELDDYDARFKDVFGTRGADMQTVGDAIAAYERTLVSGNSRFDKWKYGGDESALTALEKQGFALFTGKAGCSNCHIVGDRSALFTDFKYHATGIGYRATFLDGSEMVNVELAPGVFTKLKRTEVNAFSARPQNDLGRFEVTLKSEDRWAYKTPSLRDVALTFPYMHDGSLVTLEEVVDFYNAGGIAFDGRSELIAPLALSDDEKASLVAFLKTLSGEVASQSAPASKY